MKYKDISIYLDMTQIQNKNKVIALKELIEKKAYITEKEYVKIDNRRLPIEFNYESISIIDNKSEVIIDIGLEKEAYPSFITSNINKYNLEKQNGSWKIVNHDHEDMYMFEQSKDELIKEKSISEIHTEMDELFKPKDEKLNESENSDDISIMSLPSENHYYNSSAAVAYANDHVEDPNETEFYYIRDGDCTNFVSQVLWKGFSEHMDWGATYNDGWWAHSNGGSKNWEQVNSFWNYMTLFKDINTPGPRVNVVSSADSLNLGGIMQIDFENDDDYDHSVVLVDKDLMIFAQHTNNGYYYYWQYSGTKRFFNPSYFKEML